MECMIPVQKCLCEYVYFDLIGRNKKSWSGAVATHLTCTVCTNTKTSKDRKFDSCLQLKPFWSFDFLTSAISKFQILHF